MKHDLRKQLSARFSDKIRNKFNEVSENYPELTDQQIIETIIDNCSSNTSVDSNLLAEYEQKISSLATQVQQLEDCANEIEDLRTANESLQLNIQTLEDQNNELKVQLSEKEKESHDSVDVSDYESEIARLLEQNEHLKQEKQQVQEEANHNARLLQTADLSKQELSEGEYIVKLDEVADEMMKVTVNRLRKKFKDDSINPALIFSDLFVKYTVERPCDFAYPPQIPKEEVKVIISKHR